MDGDERRAYQACLAAGVTYIPDRSFGTRRSRSTFATARAFGAEIFKDLDAYFAGRSVDWPPTLCQRPFRLTHTSVKRRGPLTYPLADPVSVEMPVTTATSR